MKTIYIVHSESGWHDGDHSIDIAERAFLSRRKAKQYVEELRNKYKEAFPYDYVELYIEESELDDSM